MATYSQNGNIQKGKDPLDGWNWQDAGIAMVATTVPVAFGEGVVTAAIVGGAGGFVLGAGSDLATQVKDGKPINLGHAACSGLGGAEGGIAVWSGTPATKVVKSLLMNSAINVQTAAICGG
jgi:hypothetical protein